MTSLILHMFKGRIILCSLQLIITSEYLRNRVIKTKGGKRSEQCCLLDIVAHHSVQRLVGLEVFSRHGEQQVVALADVEEASGGGHGRQGGPFRCEWIQLGRKEHQNTGLAPSFYLLQDTKHCFIHENMFSFYQKHLTTSKRNRAFNMRRVNICKKCIYFLKY